MPNEWVLILRDGELVKAGIGLACFKSPFESVATFPSKLVKVDVYTQQVTKEMQGVQVSSHIEWTVDRNAPLKAFKNLDLSSGSHDTANETLRAMASAIVRNQVANSTIDHIIKNRQALREQIMTEMKEVVAGWGVHIATIEVTDVKILSSSLFKDLQSKFREENVKKATLEKLVVANSIGFEQLERNLETRKRDLNSELVSLKATNEQALKEASRQVEQFRQQCAIELIQTDRQHQEKILERQNNLKVSLKNLEYQLATEKAEVDKQCTMEKSQRQIKEQD